MTSKKLFIRLLIIVFICTTFLSARQRVYQEKTGSLVVTHHFNIETTTNGYTIHLTTESNEGSISQLFLLDKTLATQNWSYDAPNKKTKLQATRQGKAIMMKGTDEGSPIQKTFEIDELPWNQTFNIGLEQFALNTKTDSCKFWAIGVGGPGNMKITRFKVKKKSSEPILLTVGNQKMPAIYMTISLTGLLSLFWTGEYWYRQGDGVFLRYKGKNKPGASVSFMQLVSEN